MPSVVSMCVMLAVGMTFAEAVSRFNSNIAYSGLLHAVTADVSNTCIMMVVIVTCTCTCNMVAASSVHSKPTVSLHSNSCLRVDFSDVVLFHFRACLL